MLPLKSKFLIAAFFSLGFVPLTWAQKPCTANLTSNCEETEKGLSCPSDEKIFKINWMESRKVVYRLPAGDAPKTGFPVVFLFQGSLFPVEFSRARNSPYGGFYEARLIQTLLDSGFAVLAPRARLQLAWETNSPIRTVPYNQTSDHHFMISIFEAIQNGEFGPLDSKRLFATGISSGGYHTSRMAIEFPDLFKAVAIQAASYATFLGSHTPPIHELSPNHPPVIFIHGIEDQIVPISTTKPYLERLDEAGVEHRMIAVPGAGHAWFENSPLQITNWFLNHF